MRINIVTVCVGVLFTWSSLGVASSQDIPLEYQVKAEFLYQFSRFVSWPADAFASEDDPFSICMLGTDPFGPYIDESLDGRLADRRPVVLRRLGVTEAFDGCHTLFIASPNVREPSGVWSEYPMLTVGNAPDMAEGAMIRFTVEGNNVLFAINLAAIRLAGLEISARLLDLAVSVQE